MNGKLDENKPIIDEENKTIKDGAEERAVEKQLMPDENNKIVDIKKIDYSQNGGDGLDRVKDTTDLVSKKQKKATVCTTLSKNAQENVEPLINEKKKRPETILLSDKSEQFKQIVDFALEYEKLRSDRKELKERNKILIDDNKLMSEKMKRLEEENADKTAEISRLMTEVDNRNEVIGIVQADKSESAMEYKNALSAALKTHYIDFIDLKDMEMSDDIGYAVIEVLDNVFKTLEKNGIDVAKK